ncbi:ATP-binding protein [Cohnella faecalis]|uniref:histidine kinase n=1 Tax=Cohnella faecalis TaxID=2315694 RepID=A0A398CTK4_9BACL|nr:ATP-binding protein [Cohnella faecalis]RIE02294.1 PAS domain-containing protein [Cohnella faecalis]
MLKETLLQLLIVLLPVFLVLVWYDRPERSKYVPFFIGMSCAVTMLLCMHFSIVFPESGLRYDLRHVPLIIGSLYGGFPAAVILSITYIAVRLAQMREPFEFILFAAFLAVVLPLIFSRIRSFGRGNRSKRLRITYWISCFVLVFMLISVSSHIDFTDGSSLSSAVVKIFVFGSIFFFSTAAGVHFIELGFDRVQLQTQLKDVSQQYRQETRRLQQFIDSTPLAVLFFDDRGTITHANDYIRDMLKIEGTEEFIGKRFSDLRHLLGGQINIDSIERVLNGEDRISEMIQSEGKVYFAETRSVKGPGRQSASNGVLFIGHDVSELQRLKEEVDRMERLSLVGQMAASITHEIRNPMAVIRGFLQLLGERSPSEQQTYFRIVMEELDRANGIINDFLSLAQNRIVQKEYGSLNEILQEVLPLIWADANMRGQIVELRMCEQVEKLELNSKEIKQLILNLARNGMEAMDDKGLLRIETLDLADTVQLRIIDNGVGIPEEKRERLFEPFFTTKTNGTGLGLSLCLSIIERHNGKIQVESLVGEGTTIIVSFCKPEKA